VNEREVTGIHDAKSRRAMRATIRRLEHELQEARVRAEEAERAAALARRAAEDAWRWAREMRGR
jgi:hypothetical protein